VAEEWDRLLDEALRRLVAEDDVELVVAPAGALHHRLHGGIEEAEGGGEEVAAVAVEGAVEEAAAQLARLRAGAEAAADRVAPLGGIAPERAGARQSRVLPGKMSVSTSSGSSPARARAFPPAAVASSLGCTSAEAQRRVRTPVTCASQPGSRPKRSRSPARSSTSAVVTTSAGSSTPMPVMRTVL